MSESKSTLSNTKLVHCYIHYYDVNSAGLEKVCNSASIFIIIVLIFLLLL